MRNNLFSHIHKADINVLQYFCRVSQKTNYGTLYDVGSPRVRENVGFGEGEYFCHNKMMKQNPTWWDLYKEEKNRRWMETLLHRIWHNGLSFTLSYFNYLWLHPLMPMPLYTIFITFIFFFIFMRVETWGLYQFW